MANVSMLHDVWCPGEAYKTFTNEMDPSGGVVGFAITEKFTSRFCNFPAFVVFLLLERGKGTFKLEMSAFQSESK